LLPDSDSHFALLNFLNTVGDLRLVIAYPFIAKGTADEALDGVDDLIGALIALTLHRQDNKGIIRLSMSQLISDRLKISSFIPNAFFAYFVNA